MMGKQRLQVPQFWHFLQEVSNVTDFFDKAIRHILTILFEDICFSAMQSLFRMS